MHHSQCKLILFMLLLGYTYVTKAQNYQITRFLKIQHTSILARRVRETNTVHKLLNLKDFYLSKESEVTCGAIFIKICVQVIYINICVNRPIK